MLQKFKSNAEPAGFVHKPERRILQQELYPFENDSVGKGDSGIGPSSVIYEAKQRMRRSQPDAQVLHVAPVTRYRQPATANRNVRSHAVEEVFSAEGESSSAEEEGSSTEEGWFTAEEESPTIGLEEEESAVIGARLVRPDYNIVPHAQTSSSDPSVGSLALPSVPSEPSSAVDASVHISTQGSEYHIGGSAAVHFHYGSYINQRIEKTNLDPAIQAMRCSHHAEYNMTANGTHSPCTPRTQAAVLKKLTDWCDSASSTVFGTGTMAGSGKTVITYAQCAMRAKFNPLRTSCFCSRSRDCRDTNIIIPNIAFQLAQTHPPFAEALAEALRANPDVLQYTLDVQVRYLLINPWRARESELSPHTVVILDPLDECDNKFLRVLLDHVRALPFKVMVPVPPGPGRVLYQARELEPGCDITWPPSP